MFSFLSLSLYLFIPCVPPSFHMSRCVLPFATAGVAPTKDLFRSVDWQLITGVSGQPIGRILTLEDGTDPLARNVRNYCSTLRNIPEGRRSHLHRGEAWKHVSVH
jgi:hypothetical protein